jgi:halogenation protein CepH
MKDFVHAAPLIDAYLSDARRVTEGPYGQFRIRKDYSYCNTRFWKPGYALVGDAACFIDPVFSSGVHLATYSALLVARSVNTCLAGSALSETECFDEFERRYRREFGNFYQFLVAFYDMSVEEESYFWKARKIVNTDERDNIAFVRLVAGLSALDEPLFGHGHDFFDSRIGFGAWFENILQTDVESTAARDSPPPTFNHSRFDPAAFMVGFTSEIIQLHLQARFGKERPPEGPLFASGIVPSRDGLHWELQPEAVRSAV